MQRQFDFGENWSEFSHHALSVDRVRRAREEFAALLAPVVVELRGKSFVDIGFGQGLSLLSAAAMGANVIGLDINPKCSQVLQRNKIHFPELAGSPIPVVTGSVLDASTVDAVNALSPDGRGYDVVHSWGVLHHTGAMWRALDNAASLVGPAGLLVIALYNRHWSSAAWLRIKRTYCAAPRLLQRVMIGVLYPLILLAKIVATGRNPFAMQRGMDFYYNVVDWVGGYPYEYATASEVIEFLEARRFRLRVLVPARVPTGCNELIFERLA